MSQFLSLLVGGLFLGAIYALVALGFVTVFKATNVINFAQGSLVLLGAYVIARAQEPLGFWPARVPSRCPMATSRARRSRPARNVAPRIACSTGFSSSRRIT